MAQLCAAVHLLYSEACCREMVTHPSQTHSFTAPATLVTPASAPVKRRGGSGDGGSGHRVYGWEDFAEKAHWPDTARWRPGTGSAPPMVILLMEGCSGSSYVISEMIKLWDCVGGGMSMMEGLRQELFKGSDGTNDGGVRGSELQTVVTSSPLRPHDP